MRGEGLHFSSLDIHFFLPLSSLSHPWHVAEHPKLLSPLFIPPAATRHKWTRGCAQKAAGAGHSRALEHVNVLPTVDTALPTTSSLPLAPVDALRRPQHDTELAPSSFSLLLPPFTRAPAARELQWACSHARRPDTHPLLLFPPLALDQPHEHPRHTHARPRDLQRRLGARRRTSPRHPAIRLFKGTPELSLASFRSLSLL